MSSHTAQSGTGRSTPNMSAPSGAGRSVINSITMAKEEKAAHRKQKEQARLAKEREENAEREERERLERIELERLEAEEARATRNIEITPWGEMNLCALQHELSDRGEVIVAASAGCVLRSNTHSFPEARSRVCLVSGSVYEFRVRVIKKGPAPWCLGVVVAGSLEIGEYWNNGETENKVWYLSTRRGNLYNGDKRLYFVDRNDASSYYGPAGWSLGHDYGAGWTGGSFDVLPGDELDIAVDLQSEQGEMSFRKNGQALPHRRDAALLPDTVSTVHVLRFNGKWCVVNRLLLSCV